MAEFRKENEKILKGLMPEQLKEQFINGNVVNILTGKDHKGRRILVLSEGSAWDPDVVTSSQIFQLLYLSES